MEKRASSQNALSKLIMPMFLAIAVLSTGCIACNKNAFDKCGSTSLKSAADIGTTRHPVLSFGLVLTSHSLTIKECISPICADDPVPPVPMVMMSKGSSTVVGHKDGNTYSLTAAHVCMAPEPGVDSMGRPFPFSYEMKSELKLVDITGKIRVATIVDANTKVDICLLVTEGEWGKALDVAEEMPGVGEKVYNVAAPRGVFSPGMVPLFEGYYSGKDIHGDEFYTIPAAPGSSGSSILNSDGEIVGVVHSAVREFGNIAVSANLAVIKDLVDRNIED